MASLKQKLKFLAIASAGFFTDGYINLSIGLGECEQYCIQNEGPPLTPCHSCARAGHIYFQAEESTVPAVKSDIMKGGLSLGMIVGQILFGVLGDTWGRHAVYGKELMITILGTLLVILLPWNRGRHGLGLCLSRPHWFGHWSWYVYTRRFFDSHETHPRYHAQITHYPPPYPSETSPWALAPCRSCPCSR
jgi:hypothetical protein